MEPSNFDNQLYACFVAPILCKDLIEKGMSDKGVKHHWKIKNQVATLCSFAFDVDDYYRASVHAIEEINPPDMILPAFTIKDVEKPLYNYMMTCNEDYEYEVSLNKIYQVDSAKAPRMPDAFALLLIMALEKRIINIDAVNRTVQ